MKWLFLLNEVVIALVLYVVDDVAIVVVALVVVALSVL